MSISIIVAITRDGVIGRRGDQPYYIREDLRRFRTLTMGHPIIMGRRTFEALPKGALPGRTNIVVTRNATYSPAGAITAATITDAIEAAAKSEGGADAFVIGGGEIYRQAFPLADRLYVTEIDADCPDGDTFFPEIDSEQWSREVLSDTLHDEGADVDYRFVCYSRR